MNIIAAKEYSLYLKLGVDPKALFVHYQRIDTGQINGTVVSPIRPVDLVAPQVEMASVVVDVRDWIEGTVSHGQRLQDLDVLPDLPVELRTSVTYTPEAVIDYLVEIGEDIHPDQLSVHISWDQATDNVTIYAGDAFLVTYEAFIWYVGTLEELIRRIELVKVGG